MITRFKEIFKSLLSPNQGLFSFPFFSSNFGPPGPVGAVWNRTGKPEKEDSKSLENRYYLKLNRSAARILLEIQIALSDLLADSLI